MYINKFRNTTHGDIVIVDTDTGSNINQTTSVSNTNGTKTIDSDIKSIIENSGNDPESSSLNVNVNINSGITSTDNISNSNSFIPNIPNIPDIPNISPAPSSSNSEPGRETIGTNREKILEINKTLFYVLITILILIFIGGGYIYYNKQKSRLNITSNIN